VSPLRRGPDALRYGACWTGGRCCVVSEAMIRCLGTPGWGEVVDYRAYLQRAVLNQSRQWTRQRARRVARELLFDRLSLRPGVSESSPEVWGAVRRLSVRQRAVIVLTYWEDLTPAQVADRLGLSEGSVRRHLARGRARLRKVLSDE
jgi:RNA polymerase sigma factor (sigma-70 family)